jgi:hypothetical protein
MHPLSPDPEYGIPLDHWTPSQLHAVVGASCSGSTSRRARVYGADLSVHGPAVTAGRVGARRVLQVLRYRRSVTEDSGHRERPKAPVMGSNFFFKTV